MLTLHRWNKTGRTIHHVAEHLRAWRQRRPLGTPPPYRPLASPSV